MKTMNSLSGGKTSSYIAANYPADYNVFSLVRIEDQNCKFKDEKIRKEVEDRIQAPFIATAEEDTIIYTMLDLEQYIGHKIDWVTGDTFDQVTKRGDKTYLPNVIQRFCTVRMKIDPIAEFWRQNINEPIETRIGFRANETKRADRMIARTEDDGFLWHRFVVGQNKVYKKWKAFKYQKPRFPLIEDDIYKDQVEDFWKGKPVRFAYMNNCIGCFHRNELLLKRMSERHPNKFEWFASKERNMGYKSNSGGFKKGVTYDQIRNSFKQTDLFDDDFNECDSGYCGL